MPQEFFTSKILLEVTIAHQFDPQRGVEDIILERLKCPAVDAVEILEIRSNYVENGSPKDFLSTFVGYTF